MPMLDKRTVEVRVEVRVVGGAGDGVGRVEVGSFAVTAEAGSWSDKEDVQGLVQTAIERAGKKARAMAAGVDNNEKARLK